MQQQSQEFFYFVAFALLALPSQIDSSYLGDYEVLISNSGPTKLGEITAFEAVVLLTPEARTRHALSENVVYEFYWKVPSEPWIKRNKTTHRWNSFRWRWSSGGHKTVSVYVRILVSSDGGRDTKNKLKRRYNNTGYRGYSARNHTDVTVTGVDDCDNERETMKNKNQTGLKNFKPMTNLNHDIYTTNKIIATLDVYQDFSEPKTGSSMYDKTFHAGMVNLEIKIHAPQDLHNITCDWNFGDGSQLKNSSLTYLSHNFTTVAPCTVKVTLHGWSQGRYYVGTTNKTLNFTAIVPHLEITSFAGPKLPPGHQNKIAKDSPVRFEVKFKNQFKKITGVSIDWKFGDGAPVTDWKNTTIFHTYHKEGIYLLWVTIRVRKMSFAPIVKHLHVKAPVSLAVEHKHAAKDKTVTFSISCNGRDKALGRVSKCTSLPVSFHWCVSKQCNLLSQGKCSPMMEHKNSCSLIVNHTFSDSGKYCVNVGVRNGVSGTNTSLMVQIPGDLPGPKHSTGKTMAALLVSSFIVSVLLIFIVVVVRKHIYSRRKKTEKADFDFRDEYTSSLSYVDLYGKHSCFPGWGSCTKQENIPLCIQAADYKMYTL